MKKRISSYLYGLGMSSTGSLQLIGVYRLTNPSEFGEKGDKVFHLLQQDLFGDRLFWSCLVNVDSEMTRVLYDVNAKKNQFHLVVFRLSNQKKKQNKLTDHRLRHVFGQFWYRADGV